MQRIKNIIVHWSSSNEYTTVDDIRRWHVQGRGFKDIGYHRVILHPAALNVGGKVTTEWQQLVKQGRPLDMDLYIEDFEVAAAAIGFNHNSVMVCVVGGPSTKLHPLQKQALIQTCDILLKRFGLWKRDLKTHREVNPTACPGDEIQRVVDSIRKGQR